jgi:hypothetical protein
MLDALLKQDQVADVYRRIAPVYDLWARLTESKARDLNHCSRLQSAPASLLKS